MNRIVLSRARAIARSFALAGALAGTACLKSTDPLASTIDLSGDWRYTGVQIGPVAETLTGTLTISLESGSSFQGHLHLDATNQQSGQLVVLDGPVSGAVSGTNVIDFDANLDMVRRHVGQIVADTITGSWIGTSADPSTPSGTFRIERETR